MQFYCPIALFRGSGVVSGITMVKHGPQEGDYIVDISIDDDSDKKTPTEQTMPSWEEMNTETLFTGQCTV
jgi:hypothetical protein